jgi:DNA-binding CsgD family transcriptional regulator/Tfp pilus assembly protein PilF
LLEELSYECYLTDQLTEAIAARQQAMELHELADDQAAMGTGQRWLSRLSWYLGRGDDSERYAAAAVATLERVDESSALAMAYSNVAQLRMLNDDIEGAVTWGRLAIDLARRIGDVEPEIHALNNVGTALGFRPDDIEGGRDLVRSLDLALANDAAEHAARAYTNLGWRGLRNRDFAQCDSALQAGIAYCLDRDLDSWRLYMSATLARSLVEQGHLGEAGDCAAEVLAHAHLSAVTRIVALVVAAQVAARGGRPATELLAEATDLAIGTRESQRLVPVATALAEVAWLEGRDPDIAAAVDLLPPDGVGRHSPWDVGELSWWAAAGGIAYPATVPVGHPFALMTSGSWAEAAEAWERLGSRWWAAVSRAFAPDLETARVGAVELEQIGAGAVRDRIHRDRRAAGLPVPRGPRSGAPGDGLVTTREMEVLLLLVDGLSDAQIADQLFLSPKTVGHHVSSLLRKLAEPTRARAVASAVRRGLVAPKIGSSPDAAAPP